VGDEFAGRPHDGEYLQGHFPDHDSAKTAAVALSASSPPTATACSTRETREWTSDWYRPDYYAQLAGSGGVARNPRGPDTPFDPSEPGEKKRVHRGGSFLCTDEYCSRYMVGTRGKGEGSTGTNHLGFRLVKLASK
jgi:hypothetical protein